MAQAAGKGRNGFLLAAVATLAAVLGVAPAEASRYLPSPLTAALEPPAPSLDELASARDHAEALALLSLDDELLLTSALFLEEHEYRRLTAGRQLRPLSPGRHVERVLEAVWARKHVSGGENARSTTISLDLKPLNLDLHLPRQMDPLNGRFPGGQPLLFQGLWTDPVTGLSYARNRWYDARNASWLSEDPLQDVDSPNLYAGFGWGPHVGTDRMGLSTAIDINSSYGGPNDAVVLERKRKEAEERFRAWCGENPAECEIYLIREQGAMKTMGGIGLGGAGVGALAAAEPTLTSKVFGWTAFWRGVENTYAGVKQWITGERTETATHEVIKFVANEAGAHPEEGELIADHAETTIDTSAALVSAGAGIYSQLKSAPSIQPLSAYNARTSRRITQSVLDDIDIRKIPPDTRFGRAVYLSDDASTAVAEVAHHGSEATHVIRYRLDVEAARVLDLSDAAIASEWGYIGGDNYLLTQAIASRARGAGFNVIKYHSLRGEGTNFAVLGEFDNLLQPEMVVPVP